MPKKKENLQYVSNYTGLVLHNFNFLVGFLVLLVQRRYRRTTAANPNHNRNPTCRYGISILYLPISDVQMTTSVGFISVNSAFYW